MKKKIKLQRTKKIPRIFLNGWQAILFLNYILYVTYFVHKTKNIGRISTEYNIILRVLGILIHIHETFLKKSEQLILFILNNFSGGYKFVTIKIT